MADSDKEWERIGRTEPFYGVWTDEQLLSGMRDKPSEERFWLSGERHIQSVFEFVQVHLEANFSPIEALDYGCGIGRLLFPMATKCHHVTGVDVSGSMLDVARKQLEGKSLSNVSLLHASDGLLLKRNKFDLIHSHIVFQHIAPSRGYRILDQLIESLKSGGIGILHFTFNNHSRHKWLRRMHRWPFGKQIGNYIRGKPLNEPVMQMNEYNLNRIMSRIQSIADGKAHIEFTDHGVVGAIIYFKRA